MKTVSDSAMPPIRDVAQLAQVIIQTIRELSDRREALTSERLHQLLEQNQAVTDIFMQEKACHPGDTEGNGRPSSGLLELKDELRQLRHQKEQLFREMAALEAQSKKSREILTRIALSLIAYAAPSAGPHSKEQLGRMREALLSEADADILAEALHRFKGAALQEGLDERNAAGDSLTAPGKFWTRILSRNDTAPTPHPPAGADAIERVREFCTSILGEFQCNLGDDYLQQLQRLDAHIRNAGELDELLAAHQDMVRLVQQYTRRLNSERSQVAQFFSEIGRNLVEMEDILRDSKDQALAVHRSNRSFNTALEGQMEDMKHSVDLSKTLEDLKSLVEQKLALIKDYLRSKRMEDDSRLQSADEKMELLQNKMLRMKTEITQMQERTRSLEERVFQDPLTGISNRRAFDRRIGEELHRFHRYGQVFSLLLVDVDHFKQVNDRYGHWAGDQCLREISERMASVLRQSDFIARYGGEEFAVILPGIGRREAEIVAEKLRKVIEKTRFLYKGERIPITASVGLAAVSARDSTVEHLFQRVDAALYKAKDLGRNRVQSA